MHMLAFPVRHGRVRFLVYVGKPNQKSRQRAKSFRVAADENARLGLGDFQTAVDSGWAFGIGSLLAHSRIVTGGGTASRVTTALPKTQSGLGAEVTPENVLVPPLVRGDYYAVICH